MNIAILITNPNHHVELTLPVADKLLEKGISVKYISLCELRRMKTPGDLLREHALPFVQMKALAGDMKPSTGSQSLGDSNSLKRRVLRRAFWLLKLRKFIARSVKGVDRVLLMNDAAFPGDMICELLRSRRIPFYLLQEGIRFPLPNETESRYGGNGATKVLSWGERSARHFQKVISPGTEVVVTGSPRFDAFLKKVSAEESKAKTQKRLGVFTNPIDDQGFCSNTEKLALFESFVQRSADYINKEEILVSIKVHPREEVNDYLQVAKKLLNHVEKAPKSIVEAILEVDAGVIMASTVGLELLGAKKPIAQMEIPGHGYVFDYTEGENIVRIPAEGAVELDQLFTTDYDSTYFYEHVRSGDSADRILSSLTE